MDNTLKTFIRDTICEYDLVTETYTSVKNTENE